MLDDILKTEGNKVITSISNSEFLPDIASLMTSMVYFTEDPI